MPFFSKKSISETVIGFSDALMLTSIAMVFLQALSVNHDKIIHIGIMILSGGTILFSLGAYFSSVYRKERLSEKTVEEEKRLNEKELSKTISLLKAIDIAEEFQQQATGHIEKDNEEWRDYLQKHSQSAEKFAKGHVIKTVLIIAFSFIAGSLISILLWEYFYESERSFVYYTASILVIIFLFGSFKSKINGERIISGAVRLTILAATGMILAYLMAGIFVN